jgi:threonylcarbamoyladenosine tRNA methylthiotransferase MtaB
VALGCRVNRADLDAIAAQLAPGFELVAGGAPADFVVVNTCSITGDAASAARQAIRRAARENPGARIVAAGCYAEVSPGALAVLPGVAAVIGARAQSGLPELLSRLAAGDHGMAARARAPAAPSWMPPAMESAAHARPLLKVQDGCDAACAYCTVPRARGPSRSMRFEDAVAALLALGGRHREVVLTGVHLGAYGRDLAPARSLSELLREAAARGLRARVRLSSVEPREFPRGLLADGGLGGILCEHFHLPLQTGSARLLRAMRRPGGPAEVRAVVEEIAARLPGACLGADVMAGFPGETEADHRETIALIEALPLAYLHVFPFSPRPGTPAATMPGRVPGRVIRERARELRAISDRRWRAFLAAQAGRDLEVVVERVEGGLARGTARQYAAVRWPAAGEERGALVQVRVESSDGSACFGSRAAALDDRLSR